MAAYKVTWSLVTAGGSLGDPPGGWKEQTWQQNHRLRQLYLGTLIHRQQEFNPTFSGGCHSWAMQSSVDCPQQSSDQSKMRSSASCPRRTTFVIFPVPTYIDLILFEPEFANRPQHAEGVRQRARILLGPNLHNWKRY